MKAPKKPVFVGYCMCWGIALASLPACGPSQAETSEGTVEAVARQDYQEEVIEVDTSRIFVGTFSKELISNGKLEARKQSKLHLQLNEEIREVRVRNGQYVRKGDTLAVLRNFTQRNALAFAQSDRAKAELEMRDALISFGFRWEDSVQIPGNILKMARAKSGLEQAETTLEKAEYDYRQSYLLAPYPGVIANLEAEPYNMAEDFKPFCTLLDVSRYEVSFSVLEDEIGALEKGQKVEIRPFALPGKSYQGTIRTLNPLVDEHGMIEVQAMLANPDRDLIAGMNVKVLLKQAVPEQLMVPKSALVLRQGREVVFTCVRDTALWNYVKVGLENSSTYTIEEGLNPGDVVITEGNLNLAHKVRIKPL